MRWMLPARTQSSRQRLWLNIRHVQRTRWVPFESVPGQSDTSSRSLLAHCECIEVPDEYSTRNCQNRDTARSVAKEHQVLRPCGVCGRDWTRDIYCRREGKEERRCSDPRKRTPDCTERSSDVCRETCAAKTRR